MKKIFLLNFLIFTGFIFTQAQTQRMVLYEAFSNMGCAPCASQNPTNNALILSNLNKLAAIKYQTSGPGADVFHIQASQYISPRVTYYNITAVPTTILDGSTSTLNQTNINTRYAVPSPFFLEVSHSFNTACDSVTVTCIIKAAQDFTGTDLVLQLGMIEREVTFPTAPGSNGETEFHNIMRRMLPNSTGTTLQNTWLNGETDTIILSCPVPTYIYDLNQLSFITFIQSNTNKAIHQAAQNFPIPLDVYLKISSHNIPELPLCDKQHDIVIKVKNQGSTVITDFNIAYGVTGETPLTETWTGTLNAGQEVTVNLPTLSFVSNTPEMYVNIINPNGLTQYPTIHSSIKQQVKIISSYVAIPAEEKFTDTSFPPVDWVSVTYDQAAYWQRSTTGGFGQTPAGSATLKFYSSPSGQKDYLYVKGLDFTGMSTAEMSFSVAYARYNATYSDRLRVQVSTNCGSSWTSVYDKAGTTLATAPDVSTGQFTPSATQWRKDTINLNSYIGQAEVLVRFFGLSGYGNNLFIDDVVFGPSTSSIENNDIVNFFTIYPNPVNDFINIEFTMNKPGNLSVIIYDALGKNINTSLFDGLNQGNHSFNIDASKWASGLYNAVVISETNVSTYKIIKQ